MASRAWRRAVRRLPASFCVGCAVYALKSGNQGMALHATESFVLDIFLGIVYLLDDVFGGVVRSRKRRTDDVIDM